MVQQATKTSLELKDAVRTAREHLQSIYQAEGVPLENLMLEEVERSKNGRSWLITFGFDGSQPERPHPLSTIQDVNRKERIYKIVQVNAGDGQLESVKIRKV